MRTRPRPAGPSQRGQGILEYGIILSLIAMIVLGLLGVVGRKASLALCSVGNGLSHSGSAAGWGENLEGEMANGNKNPVANATALSAVSCSVSIASGGAHVLALTNTAGIQGWGSDTNGQLGDGQTNSGSTSPVNIAMPAGVTVTSVSTGRYTSYALTSTGAVYAWGKNTDGEVGVGTSGNNILTPSRVCDVGTVGTCAGGPYLSGVTKISGGADAVYALKGNSTSFLAWGLDSDHQLGDGLAASQTTPELITLALHPGANLTDIAGSQFGAYALTSDGYVVGWGNNANGQVPNAAGTTGGDSDPQYLYQGFSGSAALITGATTISHGIMARDGFSILSDGTVAAYGYNGQGQIGLGYGSGSGCLCPLTAGSAWALRVCTNGSVSPCSGATALTGVAFIGAAQSFTVGTMLDGTVWAWGVDSAYQLGQGGTGPQLTTPTQVPGVTRAIVATCGATNTTVLIGPTGTPALLG